MDNKQLTDLIKRVSTDQKLQVTEDTSLLSESGTRSSLVLYLRV